MGILQYLFSPLHWVLRNITTKHNTDETDLLGNKRRRTSDDGNGVIAVDNSPPKRKKMNPKDCVLADEARNEPSSSKTRKFPDCLIPENYDCVLGSISSRPVNSYVVINDDNFIVRSPDKCHRAALISSVSPAKDTSTISIDFTESLKNDQLNVSIKKHSNTKETQQILSGFSRFSPTNEEMSHGAYQHLLGSETCTSDEDTVKGPQNVTTKKHIIDVTDDDSETEIYTVNLKKMNLGRLCDVNQLPRPIRTPLVTPHVNGLVEHNKQIEQFRWLESQNEQKAMFGAEVFSSTLKNIAEKRFQTHLKFTEPTFINGKKNVPVLTRQMLSEVQNAQNPALDPNQVLVTKFKLEITRADCMTLKNLNWLNDTIVNFYMEMIVERSEKRIEKKYPSVYVFSTFFLLALEGGYERVRRYTKKVDLFSKELILIPIHLSSHWCLAKMDMKCKEIVYYDSMLRNNTRVLEMLIHYLIIEHRDKRQEEFNPIGWTSKNDKDIPTQDNGSDCGVFACTFAEYLARGSKFNFSQADMPFIRSKMCYEILNGKLLV